MSGADQVEAPDDGGTRPTPPRRADERGRAPDQAVGAFADEERADPGGDSDATPLEPPRDDAG